MQRIGVPFQAHLCTSVNAVVDHLPHLRDFRVRLATVCTALLAKRGRRPGSLALETLIINTSLCENGWPRCNTCGTSAWRCGLDYEPVEAEILLLRNYMRRAGRSFARLMARPQMVRIIVVADPSRKIPAHAQDELAIDCLKPVETQLPSYETEYDNDWARTGKELPSDESWYDKVLEERGEGSNESDTDTG